MVKGTTSGLWYRIDLKHQNPCLIMIMVARKHCNIDDKSEENPANIFGIKPQLLRLTKSNFVREWSAIVQTLMDYNNMDVIY